MATWTNIPDSRLMPGKPTRSIDAIALRNNPIAITEGASGAPKIQMVAFPAPGAGGVPVGSIGSISGNGSFPGGSFVQLVPGVIRVTATVTITLNPDDPSSTGSGHILKNGSVIASASGSGTLSVDVSMAQGDYITPDITTTGASAYVAITNIFIRAHQASFVGA